MSSSTREDFSEAFAALHAAVSRVQELTSAALTSPELLVLLDKLETECRRLPTAGHAMINQLGAQSSATELGGSLRHALADRLHITAHEATRRIAEAADLGQRRAITGETLSPLLPATAAAKREGTIGDAHVKVIHDFFHELPAAIDFGTRDAAETQLADLATTHRPDELRGLATQLMDWLHPDGNFTDSDRARKRGLTLGKQEADGMSRLRGYLNPELRATLEAVAAKLAAPGMCNPDDDTPVVDGEPAEEAAHRDWRSGSQRLHDGLLAGLRGLLASGNLGQHKGLPLTVVVSTTLKDLEAATGHARNGGGSRLPLADLIRMAAGNSHHYLAIFDDAKPLALFHTKRLANAAQRIMLSAKDRGCSKPGCTAPAYHCEVHHVKGWAATHRTDITDLTLACGPHNRLAESGWTTRTNAHGDTEWLPPAHLDSGQARVNKYHHPEKLLCEHDDEDEPD